MKTRNPFRLPLCIASAWVVAQGVAFAAVDFERLPEGGVQPRVAVQSDGTVHLVWLSGDPQAADVMYRVTDVQGHASSAPIRVNSQSGSAIAIGTVRGAELSLGRNGAVHVVWNGSSSALPKPAKGVPLLYARSLEKGAGFTKQQNLLGKTVDLDGGGAVAADGDGRVFVLWHGHPVGTSGGETERGVFLAVSENDGKSFAPERVIGDRTGTCACCGMSAAVVADGQVHVLYRAAREGVHRELSWLSSRDHGATFQTKPLQDWETPNCPMSTSVVFSSRAGSVLTWETRGKVNAQWLDAQGRPKRDVVAVSGKPGSKHSAAAMNSRGETLITWTEGTGWQRGGRLSWQVFDANGKPTAESGTKDGIVAWNFAACHARPDGSFVVVY